MERGAYRDDMYHLKFIQSSQYVVALSLGFGMKKLHRRQEKKVGKL